MPHHLSTVDEDGYDPHKRAGGEERSEVGERDRFHLVTGVGVILITESHLLTPLVLFACLHEFERQIDDIGCEFVVVGEITTLEYEPQPSI